MTNASIRVIKNELGNIVGYTTDITSGEVISINSKEYQDYLAEMSKPPVFDWNAVRRQRNLLLTGCDWVGLTDTSIPNKEAWLTYRQSLRDLPQNFATPEEVVWPSKPE